MMALFETLFDITYLTLVMALGVRLLFENTKETTLFGSMAIVLGLGDSFHLVPRIISHLSPLGFAGHGFALSWGQFVTSITMTVFYVLFYYYYRQKSGDDTSWKPWLIYLLAAIRIGLVCLAQNDWGHMPGNYTMGLIRNIPFAILGAFLIYWTYQHKDKPGLRKMSLLIFLSFIFYLPVVLFSQSIPAFGAFMLPKTVAYLMIVILGYRHYLPTFKVTNLLATAMTLLVMGLLGGVFYRELTKFYHFTQKTHLSVLHVHTLVLGFIVLLILYILCRNYSEKNENQVKRPFYIYMSGLVFTLINMIFFGMMEVVGQNQYLVNIKILLGLSGIGHILLSVGLVWLMVLIYRFEKTSPSNSL